MVTVNYLTEYASKKIWCTPNQDKQAIIKPTRISQPYGNRNETTVMWRRYYLPDITNTYHVFQVGQIYFTILNLLPNSNTWVSFDSACNANNLIVELYTTNGIRIPNHKCYYRMTEDRDLIIIVPNIKTIGVNMGIEDLYFRVYSNAYFQSKRSDPLNDYIKVIGTTITSLDDILTIQRSVIKQQALAGNVMCYVNGFLVSAIDPFTTNIGDVVEYIYDSSIKKVVDINISDMETFVSIKDSVKKYLVHPPKDLSEDNTISYFDDNTCYLYNPDINGRFKGIYYHLNMVSAIRMVTHRDYSIIVNNVVALNNSVNGWVDPEALVFRLYIRKSGYERPLVYEANGINELYKLPDNDILRAMLGIDSTVPYWRAEYLENSSYPLVMGYLQQEIPIQLTEDALGYNAISKILGDTPSHTYQSSNQTTVDVPYALQNKSVAFEYDSLGKLLGSYQVSGTDTYTCKNNIAKLVELMSGVLSDRFDETTGLSTTLDPNLTYRFYLNELVNGVDVDNWVDVTNSNRYITINGTTTTVQWNIDPTKCKTLIRSDKNIVTYNINRTTFNGPMEFDLQQGTTINGATVMTTLQIAPGELDIFLNGRELAENLDYYVVFPKVVIINKAYLNDPLTATQNIVVRMKGLSNTDLSREQNNDVGFVKFGMLSGNNKFDIRDDRVQRIVIGGYLYAKDELSFYEDNSNIGIDTAMNGLPYTIRDIIVPHRGQCVTDTYVLRDKSKLITKSISDYLTLKLPQIKPTGVFTIPDLYHVFSPFCCRLIYDIRNGTIDNDAIKDVLTFDIISNLCKPYLYLLDFDPVSDNNTVDTNFVYVQPHNLNTVINLDIYQYRFVSEAIKLYLKDRVILSGFVQIASAV